MMAWDNARTAMVVVLAVLLTMVPASGFAAGPAGGPVSGSVNGPVAGPAQAMQDLGALRADGVTLTDSLGSFGQANAYSFRVTDGPGTVQVYVGDLWYDVEVLLLRASALPDDSSQWRGLPCAAGCVVAAPPSARRRIQFIQPKGLIESVENGAYAVLVRPRDEADFSASASSPCEWW
jgi:hypothetical protein